jgi:hypothetical protein
LLSVVTSEPLALRVAHVVACIEHLAVDHFAALPVERRDILVRAICARPNAHGQPHRFVDQADVGATAAFVAGVPNKHRASLRLLFRDERLSSHDAAQAPIEGQGVGASATPAKAGDSRNRLPRVGPIELHASQRTARTFKAVSSFEHLPLPG